MNNPKAIQSVEQLKEEACETSDFFIALNGGIRSSKSILFDEGIFYIHNDIDESEEELTEEQLFSVSNIGTAINKKAFFKY